MENNTNKIKIELNMEVTNEDIDDIMASALDGGISYWCRKAEVLGEYLGEYVSEQISKGGILKLYDIDTDKDPYILTKELFLDGLKRYLGNVKSTDCLYMYNGKLTIDPGHIDGNAADSIIQYALFGVILFA